MYTQKTYKYGLFRDWLGEGESFFKKRGRGEIKEGEVVWKRGINTLSGWLYLHLPSLCLIKIIKNLQSHGYISCVQFWNKTNLGSYLQEMQNFDSHYGNKLHWQIKNKSLKKMCATKLQQQYWKNIRYKMTKKTASGSTISKKTASGSTVLKLLQIWNANINVVFSAFYVRNLFCVTESVPKNLWSFLVCRFTCSSCYTGETTCHLTMKIKEHLETESKLTILKHLKKYQIV